MTLEIQALAYDRCGHVAELSPLMGSQPSPFDNWTSNGNTDSLPLQKTTYYDKNE